MDDKRRRELWQMKLNAMPDDMIESEYRRRLAKRRWSKTGKTVQPQAASSTELDAMAFFERIVSKHSDT